MSNLRVPFSASRSVPHFLLIHFGTYWLGTWNQNWNTPKISKRICKAIFNFDSSHGEEKILHEKLLPVPIEIMAFLKTFSGNLIQVQCSKLGSFTVCFVLWILKGCLAGICLYFQFILFRCFSGVAFFFVFLYFFLSF